MILSRYNLKNINTPDVVVPVQELFELPEKVLQFGTGVLLRGLPDYFIDKANRMGIFNGRIVVVKSTDQGSSAAFDKQDSLYTLCVRGVENETKVEENIICSSISRVLSAASDWKSILEFAHNPNLQVIISNTTEVGISLVNDDVQRHPPVSFPGKLLAVLFERYQAFNGSEKSGLIIIPTELISDNGKKLEAIILELAHLNGMRPAFIDWLETNNRFCNSLVDRIVPGKPDIGTLELLHKDLAYTDDLLTIAEPYRLWAIEGDENIAAVLSFSQVDEGVIVSPNIDLYRELKLRMLNGTHTLSCGLAFLAGFETVKSAMDNKVLVQYITQLMCKEIALAIPYPVEEKTANDFALKVIDRFSNPYIQHLWINITQQYSTKIKMRVIPVLLQHYNKFNTVPDHIAMGFAGYLCFMKVSKKENGQYFGDFNNHEYQIVDDQVEYFYRKSQNDDETDFVDVVLNDKAFWAADLTALPGFIKAVNKNFNSMQEHGVSETLDKALVII